VLTNSLIMTYSATRSIVVHRMPVAKVPWYIAPGNIGAGDREDRLVEQAITQCRRIAGFLFNGGTPRLNRSRGRISDDHPDSQDREFVNTA
jgi:hypothetical protein